MIDLSNVSRIFVGSIEIGAVYVGSQKIWPAAFECELSPESWNYGGQYLISTIPAAGGYASPTRWVFTIKNPVTHEVINTIYINSLPTTPTIEEEINGVWVPAQNFSFVNNRWQANDRGTNGYGETGSVTPQNAPARHSRITATYRTTYNNVQCSATYTQIMTQNGNNAVVETSYYRIYVRINNFYDIWHQAPASRATATVTATADFCTIYDFVDAVTGDENPAKYTKVESDVATTDDFSFSSSSWITVGTPTSQGVSVVLHSRGTDYDSSYREGEITAFLTGTALSDSINVYQAMNVYIDQENSYTDSSAAIYTDPEALEASDNTFEVLGTFYFESRKQYSSGEWGEWEFDYAEVTPVINSVSPYYDSIVGNVVTVPDNEDVEGTVYTIVATITYDGIVKDNLSTTITQSGIPQVITFGALDIVDFYYPEDSVSSGYNIPASGGTVKPVIIFTIDYSVNGSHSSSMVLHGEVDDGESSGTLSDGTATCDFNIYYFVGGQSSQDGAVTSGDRGTNPDAEGTTVITVANNCYARVSMDNKSQTSDRVNVTRQANHEEEEVEFNQTYSIVDLGFEWNSHNAKALSAGEEGYLTWAECKEYYYIRTYYTSGAYIDGATRYDRDINAKASESSTWLTASGYYVTASKNSKSGSERSATVYAVYNGNTLGSVTVTQAETISWYSLESSSASGLSFTAAGGNKTVTFTGYHRYDNGDSPDTTNSPSVSVTYDGDVANRISNSGSEGRKITVENLGTTPYDEVSTYYTFRWNLHSSATCDIPVYQGPNEPGNFGTVNFPSPGSSVAAGGSTINLVPSCSFTWTSGSSGTMLADGFNFEYITKGNKDYRTYDFVNDHYAEFGSLGTNNRPNRANTYIRATLIADSSKYADAVIQEEPNVPVETSLSISWSVGSIPSYGGSTSIGVASARLRTEYSSGELDSGTSVAAGTILNNTTCQADSGIVYSHTYDEQSADLSAVANEGYNPSAKEITLTTTYGGDTVTETQIVQQPVAYRTQITQQSGVTYAQIRNADTSNGHTFDYTVTIDGSDSTGTAVFNRNDSSWRTVGATQSSGHIITITITAQDGHNIIR